MSDCSSFVTPEDLAQIRADYRKARWLMTEGRDNIVKAAVEWYETMTAFSDMPDDLIGTETMLRAEHAWYEAWEQLAEAVKRWKEAQGVLVSEQVLTLSNTVGTLTNKAYTMAPMLVSDLQALSGDLRGLYEAVLEIEPSREDVARVEKRLRAYAYTLSKLAHGTPSWRKRAWLIDNPSHNPRDDVRVQGGAQIELAQRLVEKWEALAEEVEKTFHELQGEVDIVEKALAELPDRMRRLIEMRYLDGLSMDEVSAELNICRREAYYTRDEALLMLVPYLA